MGLYDIINVKCPSCGEEYGAQSKSGECTLAEYDLTDAPTEVLRDANRHAPFSCSKCALVFCIDVIHRKVVAGRVPHCAK